MACRFMQGPYDPTTLRRLEAQLASALQENDAVSAFFPTPGRRACDGARASQCTPGGPVVDCHSTPDLSTLVFITSAHPI